MKRLGTFLIMIAVLFSFGCQQPQQLPTASGIGRKEKLLASEIINLKLEIKKTNAIIERQNVLIKQLKQKNETITRKSAEDYNTIQSLAANYSVCNNDLIQVRKQLEECQKMVDLTDVPALCRDKIERQKKLLDECQKEKQEIAKSTEESSSFLKESFPTELMKQIEELTAENEQLKAKIAEFEKKASPK